MKNFMEEQLWLAKSKNQPRPVAKDTLYPHNCKILMNSLMETPSKEESYANDLYLLGSSHNWIVSIFQSPYNQSGVKLKLYLQSGSFVIELFSKL